MEARGVLHGSGLMAETTWAWAPSCNLTYWRDQWNLSQEHAERADQKARALYAEQAEPKTHLWTRMVVDSTRMPAPADAEWRPGLVTIGFDALKTWFTPNGWRDPHRIVKGFPADAMITRVEPCYDGPGNIRVHFLTREVRPYQSEVWEETFHDPDIRDLVNGKPKWWGK